MCDDDDVALCGVVRQPFCGRCWVCARARLLARLPRLACSLGGGSAYECVGPRRRHRSAAARMCVLGVRFRRTATEWAAV